MTFKDIKNISDDEFIEFFKNYLPKEKIDEIYNKKLSKNNKKIYIYSTITLGTLMDIISVETLDGILKQDVSQDLNFNILLGSMLLSYIIISKLKNKEFNLREEKFNKMLIDIKANICNLSLQEFNILVSSYEYIAHNNISCNINSNVLGVINKLLSINAINVLNDFEIENNLSKSSNHYEDNCDIFDKAYKRGD